MNIQIGAAILDLRVSQWWYAKNSVRNEFPELYYPQKIWLPISFAFLDQNITHNLFILYVTKLIM